MSTSWVTSGAPWVIAARPPMSTHRTRFRPSSRMTASGWNSPRWLTRGLQVRAQVPRRLRRRLNPLLRRALQRCPNEAAVHAQPDLRHHLEREAGRVEHVEHRVETRPHRPSLYPGDRRLRDPGTLGQRTLGQAGPPPCISDHPCRVHRSNDNIYAITKP